MVFAPATGDRSMSSPGSITQWLGQLKEGDRAALQPIWEAYFQRLVAQVRRRLSDTPRRAADEEDVVLSALKSFCRATEQGRLPKLDDRHDLWMVLCLISRRKADDLRRHERRARRDARRALDEAALAADSPAGGASPLAWIQGREPSPDDVAALAEEGERRLRLLGDDELRTVAVMRLEGYSVEEIAAHLGLTDRTVRRRVALVRRIWYEGADHE
jgi:DNA-directed RNA polymerase specialized sigma24 family protein